MRCIVVLFQLSSTL